MRKNYDFLDITKFVLALMVAAVHVNPLGADWGWMRFPLTRVAVPLFFLISGYLLFDKMNSIDDRKAQRSALWKFAKRNLQLYLAWFILLFPITAYTRGYFSGSLLAFLGNLPVQILLGSTFTASWYLMALVLGALLVYLIGRYLGGPVAMILGVFSYVICCLTSNYGYLFGVDSWIIRLREWYPTTIYNSFPVALLWLAVGKWIADNKSLAQKISPAVTGGIACACLIGLFLEHGFIQKMGCSYENDCYFMLVPICIMLFITAMNIKMEFAHAKALRRFSTVIYCLHGALALVLGWILRYIEIDRDTFGGGFLLYLLVICGCGMATVLIHKLSCTRLFAFLRYFV